ncbi:hypothetical protein [Streptomyces sp. NPDC018059]|uniref:hypothetical protein n=1 Tax=Streptomyces sp. NPDC018059 TaxID=3365041 RepID=UPI0037A3B281
MGRSTDLQLVLGRLSDLPLARFMDSRRIGLYGHSAGGTATVYAARDDRRVGAVVNLEGYLDLYPKPAGLDQPLLLFRTDGFDGATRVESSWAGLPGRRVLLPDANHWAFTDYGSLVGPGDPAVTLAAVRRRVGTFFARHL